jgi:hypothetical protein
MTPGHQHTPPGQLSVVEEVKYGKKNKMPVKIKPSSKKYKKDKNGKMSNQWVWEHYTVTNTSTVELKKYFTNPSYKRKKAAIKKELIKRNEEI